MTAGVGTASGPMAFWAFVLIFMGAGAKAGMFPFHTWIPDAARVMPASGFAALPASLEKVLGIYFLFVVTQQMSSSTRRPERSSSSSASPPSS
jgi:formate hydrogenlyase subunit 3/multisubunit Na+/H+ antiporter MnhD subunit